MSIIDKVIAAVTPTEDSEKNREARAKAEAVAGTGWLAMVLDHHKQIEQAFEAVRHATTATARKTA